MRKPAGQQTLDEAEELPVQTDPDGRLTDRQGDQLAVTDRRWPATPGRDPIVVSEDIACNNKGFQIRHLELQSRGDTVWKPFFAQSRVPANPADFHIKPLVKNRRRRCADTGTNNLANVTQTTEGPVRIDLEDACVGPREWDLACLVHRGIPVGASDPDAQPSTATAVYAYSLDGCRTSNWMGYGLGACFRAEWVSYSHSLPLFLRLLLVST